MVHCKSCHKSFIPSDVLITEEIPREKGGGFIYHNFGPDVVCSVCRGLAFAEDDYHEMFEETWVKPVKSVQYRE